MKYFRFDLVMWQNLYWLLFIKLLKRWIFVVFHLADTTNLLIKIRYPLSFVVQTDTLDLLISIGYSLSFAIELDSSNLSIEFYKNNRKCLGFNSWRMYEQNMRVSFDLIRWIQKTIVHLYHSSINFIFSLFLFCTTKPRTLKLG